MRPEAEAWLLCILANNLSACQKAWNPASLAWAVIHGHRSKGMLFKARCQDQIFEVCSHFISTQHLWPMQGRRLK